MPELVLGESLEVLIDHRGKTPKKLGGDFTATGVPVASAMLVQNGKLRLDEARHVSLEIYYRWMPVPTRCHDVLLTSEAPLGRVALVPDGNPLVLGQRLFGLRGKIGILDSVFLFYAIQTGEIQNALQGRSSGTTVSGIRQSELVKIKINAPSYIEQRAIVSVLKALDEKIAANEQIVDISDSLLQAHFLETPVGASREVKLGDLMGFRYGKALKEENRTPGRIPVFGGNGVSGWHDTPLDEGPGVIVGRKGANAGSVTWSQGPFWPIDTSFYVESTSRVPLEFLFFALEGAGLRNHVGDSAIPGLNREIALSLTMRIPADEAIRRFTEIARPILALRAQMQEESHSIAELRDALLPKLMSGEIRVRDAEKVVEDVT